jgi:hypothetical protein
MAGYSGTPLPKKLGIKPGARLLRVNPPEGLDDWLAPLPEGVRELPARAAGKRAAKAGAEADARDGPADVILFFTTQASELAARFGALAARLHPAGGLWVGWPKKSAKVPTDLDENRVRAVGLAAGLVDNKVCAISEVWSGLRFVVRLKDR